MRRVDDNARHLGPREECRSVLIEDVGTVLFEQWHMLPILLRLTEGPMTLAVITRLRVPRLLAPSRWD